MNDGAGQTILLVDDDTSQAAAAVPALTTAGDRLGYQPDEVDRLVALEDERQDLVILDWDLPHLTGEIFLYAIFAGMDTPPPVIALARDETNREVVLDAGARAGLAAPPDAQALVQTVRTLLDGTEPVRRPRAVPRSPTRSAGE